MTINLIISRCKELWVDSANEHLYLEPYCEVEDVSDSIEKKYAEVAFESFSAKHARKFVNSRIELYLPKLIKVLGEVHSFKNNEFWERSLSLYLRDLIGVTHYFFTSLEKTFDVQKHTLNIAKKPSSMAIFGTAGYADFQYWHINDEGRELYAAEYFRTFYPGRFDEKPLIKTAYQETSQTSRLSWLTNKVTINISPLNLAYKIVKKIVTNRERLLVVGVAHKKDIAAKLYFRSLGKVSFSSKLPEPARNFDSKTERDCKLRGRISRAMAVNECRYEKYLRQCIETTMPWTLLEGFDETYKMYSSYWNSYPELKFVLSENFYQDDAMAYAVLNSCGVSLVKVPHFAPLDIFAASQLAGQHVLKDKVLSRGHDWINENTIGVGTLYPYEVGKLEKHKTIDILYISTDFYPYFLSYEQSADGTGERVAKIFSEFTETLFRCIPKEIVKKISIKKRPEHICIQIHSSYPSDVVILDANKAAKDYMSTSNLVVIEGVSTAFLEALTSNIPTLNFFPSSLYDFEESKENYYSELMDAGIVFDDPVLLAAKIVDVQTDTFGWWYSEKIQKARRSFLYKNLSSSLEGCQSLLSLVDS